MTEVKYENYKGLINSWIYLSRVYVPNMDYDDLCQIGAIGFLQALKIWDGKRSFEGILRTCVFRRIYDEINKANQEMRKGETLSFDFLLAGSEGGEETLTLHDVISSKKNSVESEIELKDAISRISFTELENKARILKSMGYSITEISEIVGERYKTIDNAIQRSRKKMAIVDAI